MTAARQPLGSRRSAGPGTACLRRTTRRPKGFGPQGEAPASRRQADLELAAAGACPPEQSLWQAVLRRAVNDALGQLGGAEAAGAARPAIATARAWFETAGADFRSVCDWAGFEPEVVHERMLPLLAAGAAARAELKLRLRRNVGRPAPHSGSAGPAS